ncbi:MAG: DUF4347 domain-containing protein, partial [Merismopedia sp. SIO2A8]|nr:DUF4347 domain-containing protein [Merismopedia sp. SIO2A8]
MLHPDQDGIQQISDWLRVWGEGLWGEEPWGTMRSLHIVSHGAPGQLTLGNSVVNLDALPQYAHLLAQWFPDDSEASVTLYGCNVAAGAAGAAFIQSLHTLTGAGISASTHTVGHFSQGGSWNLDHQIGIVQPQAIFSKSLQQVYQGSFPEIDRSLYLSNPNSIWPDRSYFVGVLENQTFVIDINATDNSDTEGNGLTYSIIGGKPILIRSISYGNAADYLSIDPISGVITFNAPPIEFRERFGNSGDLLANHYVIDVGVTDSENYSDEQTFRIAVRPTTSTPPEIISAPTATVQEGQLVAIDV